MNRNRIRKWLVMSPVFEYTEVVFDGRGPIFDVRDVIEIEAETKRDAIKLGVVAMMADRKGFEYCLNQRRDNASPYTGMTAEDVTDFRDEDCEGAR